MMTLEIAARLTQLRKERGYSQEDLAERIGVSRQAVSKWERAEASPDTDNLIALAALYGVTLDQLIHGGAAPVQEDGAQEAPAEEPAPVPQEEQQEESEAEDCAEASEAEDPLPHGSYFEDKARREEAEKEEKRRRLPYPLFTVAAYLVMGFAFGWWHPGWIIFLTIPLYYLPDSQREYTRLLGNPIMITIIYLLLGCLCGWWHPGWLVFLLIPLLNRRR